MLRRGALVICCGIFAACTDEPATETAADAAPTPAAAPAEQAPSAAPPTLPRTAAPADAMVYIVSPTDGESITSPVRVVFGLQGAGVAPAGFEMPATGHHHVLVDTGLANMGLPIPADEQHIHFGGGQTEAVLELSPGTHTLQLVLGDHLHIPHDPPLMSEVVTVEVQP
ncbi:DUF4399 domain-containing protein [Candidatus Rariloculus sp.]|uniref:DUF4399 domain-containing protein n=1 Tax=Candidatus Rariloculus sp. TaxID=3101265 RepID=UPI003D12DAE0